MNRREFFHKGAQVTAATVVSGEVAAETPAEPPATTRSWEERVAAMQISWERPPGRKGPEPSPEEAWVLILLEELNLALDAVAQAHQGEHPGEWCAFCFDCHYIAWSIGNWHSLLSSIRWGGQEAWAKVPELAAVCQRIREEA